MKLLSPRPQTSKTKKDRLGNTISPSREPPFTVGIWFACLAGTCAGYIGYVARGAGVSNDIWQRIIGYCVSLSVLCVLNFALNRLAWYRDFKRSPLLINGTNLILVGVVLFLCWQTLRGTK